MTRSLTTLVLVAASLCGVTAMGGLIDDFGDADLSEYTFYKVLDQGDGTTNISLSSPSGQLTVTSTGTTGAEQVLFLRPHVLEVGQEYQVEGPPTTVGATNDFGLAVGATPVDLGDPAAGDNRSQADFLFISYRTATQLNHRGFLNGVEVGQHQAFGVNADKLFIARPTIDSIELGYYDGNNRVIVEPGNDGGSSYMGITDLSLFNNVGFYVDLREDGAGYSGLDNLTVTPEPTSALMALIVMMGLTGLRKRQS